jgi:sterol desaturase/sphingolipid hydroxylase (fatty acid hydroxylase superfamily)
VIEVAMLGVLAWWIWLLLSWAFFLFMPWLINHSFARFFPQTRIHPACRIKLLQEARKGRWQPLIGLHLINSGIIGLCIAAGGWLQAEGIGHLHGGPLGFRGWLLFEPQMLLALIVFDTQFYWVHRAAHAWPLLYRNLHRDHHVDRFPDTTHHDFHHQLVHSNYSLYFTHWDRWMGTQALDQSCP